MNKKLFSYLALFSILSASIASTPLAMANDDLNAGEYVGEDPLVEESTPQVGVETGMSEKFEAKCKCEDIRWTFENRQKDFIAQLEKALNNNKNPEDCKLIKEAIQALRKAQTPDELIRIFGKIMEKINPKKLPPMQPGEPTVVEQNNLPPAGYEDEVFTVFSKNPFSDTDINLLSGKAAAELYRRAVIGGYPDGEFKGQKSVNRAEAAKFLLLSRFGEVSEAANSGQFKDVLDGQWYTKYVVTAANKGIINGYEDGTFKPGDTVNTAEFLKMLSLTFDLGENLPYEFEDVADGQWFAAYAGVASKYKLFPERGSKLLPEQELTREEVAIAIYQFLSNR